MEQTTIARQMKAAILGMALCGLAIYGWGFPSIGSELVWQYPELSGWYWPWLGFLWATGLPCYGALALAWRVAGSIGADRAFTAENADLLRGISRLAAGDSALFFVGNLVLLCLNMNHPGVALVSLLVSFGGTVIAVASAALSHLIRRAAVLQEQSDWTI